MTLAHRTAWLAPFDAPELSYAEAEAMAHDTGFFGNTGDPLLETVVEMLDELERPDESFDVIQVAGTNGKTSTSRYTAAVLAGEGLRCALYTSPELVEMRERMEVAGAPVSREAFAHGIALAAEAGRRVNARREAAGERPFRVTEFDLLTVAACVVFAEAGVDVAVLEVGLGGRWDATTATRPKVTCVTGIGLDHMRILGDTLEAIAGEKAAVIRRGQRCVLGAGTASPASVEDVFLARCAEQGVEPVLLRPELASDAPGELEGLACAPAGSGPVGAGRAAVGPAAAEPGAAAPGAEPSVPAFRAHPELPHASYHVTRRPERVGGGLALNVTTPLATYRDLCAARPVYQAANIACAVTLAETYLGWALDQYRLSDVIGECPTPGRFNVVQGSPLQLIDAAHNPQSVRAFLDSLAEMEPEVSERPQLLCAVLRDKDVAGIVGLLAHAFPRVVVTATSSPRALPAAELAEAFRTEGVEPVAAYEDVASACAALAGESYVAVGSITLAGEVAAWHRR